MVNAHRFHDAQRGSVARVRGQNVEKGQVLTVAFAICTDLVFGLLYELTKDLCVAFGGRLVCLVHRCSG